MKINLIELVELYEIELKNIEGGHLRDFFTGVYCGWI